MTWIDNKKAYNFVPHSWINECMKMFGMAENMRNLFEKNMKQWQLALTSNGEELGGGGGCGEDLDLSRRKYDANLFVLGLVQLAWIIR